MEEVIFAGLDSERFNMLFRLRPDIALENARLVMAIALSAMHAELLTYVVGDVTDASEMLDVIARSKLKCLLILGVSMVFEGSEFAVAAVAVSVAVAVAGDICIVLESFKDELVDE